MDEKDISETPTEELIELVKICKERCCATEEKDRRKHHALMKRVLDELQRRGEITMVEKWRRYLYCKTNCILEMRFPAFAKCECNLHASGEVVAEKKASRVTRARFMRTELNALAEILQAAKRCPVNHEKRKLIIENIEEIEEIEFQKDEIEALESILTMAVKCPVDKKAAQALLQKIS